MPWGSDTNNESKPDWGYLSVPGRANADPKSANVFATDKGWTMRWPWGDEVLVAIGGLATNLGNADMAMTRAEMSGLVANTTAQALTLLIEFNEAVVVTGTPTVAAIAAAANSANVTLSYDSSQSDPSAGKLVFANTALDLSTANVGGTFVVNSTSTVSGFDGITDAGDASVVANGVASGLSAVFTIEAAA